MKTILALLLFLCLRMPASAQDATRNVVGAWTADSLTASQDTLDFVFRAQYLRAYCSISAYTASGTDTINVYSYTINSSFWVQHALIDLSDNTIVTRIIVTTTPKEFLLVDQGPPRIRLIGGRDPSTTYLVLGMKSGTLGYPPWIGSTKVSGADSFLVRFSTPQPMDQKDKSFSVLDSISVNTVAPSVAYAANDNVGAALLIFRNVNDYSGQGVTITNLTMFADTGNTSNATFFNNFLRDSAGVGAFTDNAAFALPAANWNSNFVERVVLALANTYGLTTFAEGSTNISPFVIVPAARNVYVRVTAGAVWLGKYNGKLYARIRGYKN